MKRSTFFNDTFEELYDPVQQTVKTIPYIEKIYGPQIHKRLLKETLKAQSLRKDTPGGSVQRPVSVINEKDMCGSFSREWV